MSKRRVQFADGGGDDDLEQAYLDVDGDASGPSTGPKQTRFGFKEKHSLDSDEEDNVEKYDMMNEDDIEGQEDSKVDIEEGITFTPFNMREELEEGHFDTDGMYIFKKDKNQIKDSWMDNIDWVKVKERTDTDPNNADEDSEDEDYVNQPDEINTYKLMLELMKPGESILKALRRLGGGKAGSSSSSASQRWKKTKQKTGESSSSISTADKDSLLKLTGYADLLLSAGNMEIYQDTYEKLSFKVKLAEDKDKAQKPSIPDDADDDDALDMFAENFDKKKEPEDKSNGHSSERVTETSKLAEEATDTKPNDDDKNQVRWEYKWQNEEAAEVHGPFTSSQMLGWSESDFFEDGVFVRKVGAEGHFYSSRRIDFDLYT